MTPLKQSSLILCTGVKILTKGGEIFSQNNTVYLHAVGFEALKRLLT
jgi:hypothetical protein